MAKKHELPYANMDEAIKDGFKKIGGAAEAFRFMDQGNYAIQERKLQNERNSKMRELLAKDDRFKSLREQAKKQIG